MAFDPDAPLPHAPDPWNGSSQPPERSSSPFITEDMIAAEPALARRLLDRLGSDSAAADLAAVMLEASAVTITGCGTSLHAAEALAEMLTDVGIASTAVQALEVVRRDRGAELVIAVSHEGGTWATNEALRASRERSRRTALITVSDRSPGAELSDMVIATDEQDQSWCHTVGYLSPLLVGAWLTSSQLDSGAVSAWLRASPVAAAEPLARCDRLLVAGTGIDLASARELALKVEEGARLPSVAMHTETVRHGHLAAADEHTGLVVIRTITGAPAGLIRDRTEAILRSGTALGMPTVVLEPSREAAPDGLAPTAAAALGVAIGLQRLAVDLAKARGMNPDAIGRTNPRQRAAAEA